MKKCEQCGDEIEPQFKKCRKCSDVRHVKVTIETLDKNHNVVEQKSATLTKTKMKKRYILNHSFGSHYRGGCQITMTSFLEILKQVMYR